jgi:hypothetical protein
MQEKSFKRLAIVSCLIILIITPLVISFNAMKTNNEISSKVYDTLNENIKNDVIFYNI